jgi:hypothetical protein
MFVWTFVVSKFVDDGVPFEVCNDKQGLGEVLKTLSVITLVSGGATSSELEFEFIEWDVSSISEMTSITSEPEICSCSSDASARIWRLAIWLNCGWPF